MTSALNHLFSTRQINQLIRTGKMPSIDKACAELEIYGDTYEVKLEALYQYLGQHHRNEYWYKNELLNRFVLQHQHISAIREYPVGEAITDFIVCNGDGALVLEIKTELDTLKRLRRQIDNYYQAFDKVALVTVPDKATAVVKEDIIPKTIGIYEMQCDGQLINLRKATPYRDKLDSHVMFRLLRKNEYEAITKEVTGSRLSVNDFDYWKANERIFCELSVSEQQTAISKILYRRNQRRNALIKSTPNCLHALLYFSKYNEAQIEQIQRFLEQKEGD